MLSSRNHCSAVVDVFLSVVLTLHRVVLAVSRARRCWCVLASVNSSASGHELALSPTDPMAGALVSCGELWGKWRKQCEAPPTGRLNHDLVGKKKREN